MKKYLFAMLLISVIIMGAWAADSKEENSVSSSHAVSRVLELFYEGESFESLVAAWSDVKMHSLYLLELAPDITEVYPGGEVLDYQNKKYTNGYVFITSVDTESGVVELSTQVDIEVLQGLVRVNYAVGAEDEASVSGDDLKLFADKYEENIMAIDKRIQIFLVGEKRLYKLYHREE